MKETIEAKKDGKNIELDDVTVINETYQDLSKEPNEEEETKDEENKEAVEETEEKTEEDSKEESKEEEKNEEESKEEEKEEEKTEAPKIEMPSEEPPVVETPKVEVPPVIETPVVPELSPKAEPAAPIGGFEIPNAPISESAPSVQFPSAPVVPDAPVSPSFLDTAASSEPSLFGQDFGGSSAFADNQAASIANQALELEGVDDFMAGYVEMLQRHREEETAYVEQFANDKVKPVINERNSRRTGAQELAKLLNGDGLSTYLDAQPKTNPMQK